MSHATSCMRNPPLLRIISREWTLLLPAYSIVIVLLTYFVYFAIAIARTPAFSDPSTFIGEQSPKIISVAKQQVDTKAHLPALGAIQQFRHADPDVIPELYDIPIGVVNRVVYGPHRSPHENRPSGESLSTFDKNSSSSIP